MVSGWCAVSAWCRRRWDDLTQGSSLRATRFGFPRHRLCLREDGHMHAPRVHVKGWWGDVPEHEVRPPADDPRVGGGAASALRHRDVSMRRRQAVAREHRVELFARRPQPDGDAGTRGDRTSPCSGRPVPGSAGKAGVPGQYRAGRAADPSRGRPTGPGVTGFVALLDLARGVFRAPSFAIFTDLVTGWVCAPGRRTITNMITVADPVGRRAHDAYHRFVRDGAWSMNQLWQSLATHLVGRFCPTGVVEIACDDTLFHREGRKVEGAGTFRDAVRSTIGRVVYARGLNLVVITLTVHPPWGGCPIAVPVNVRAHKKHDATT